VKTPFQYGKKKDRKNIMDIKSETSTILDLPPSAVAFCPSHPEFYVVGTYFLHPKEESNDETTNSEYSSNEVPQKRTGTLILYRLEGSVL
jgi:diphthamide biosynthesis protein 7